MSNETNKTNTPITNATQQSRISELEQQIAKSDKEEHDQFRQQQSRIAELEHDIERLKQSVEYWRNENSKTGNSYLKLLSEHNELKSELERIKTESK